MSRGRRFDDEPKLNMKKVFATVLAFIVVILIIISIKNLFTKDKMTQEVAVQTTYFTVFNNNKYGVIDNKGNVIIKPTYAEMIIIPEKTEPLFICTYNVDYENNTYETKVLNASCSEILTEFDKVQAIENSTITDVWYEDNVLSYEVNGLKGLIKFDGTKITEPIYDSVYSLDGIEKTIIIEKAGLKGIVNSEMGSIIADAKYSEIKTLNKTSADNGYIVKENDKYGIVSGNGKIVLDANYTEIQQVASNELFVVNDGNGFKVVNTIAEVVIDGGFDQITEIHGDKFVVVKDSKYGIILKDGTVMIPIEYEDLKFAQDKYYIAKKASKYGIISEDNTICIEFKYNYIVKTNKTNFYQAENEDNTTDIISSNFEVKLSNVIISELNEEKGYLRVRENGKYNYYNFNFEKKENKDVLTTSTLFLVKDGNGKYGYVNKNNELIVNYQYDDAKEQNAYGYCVVKKDGFWGVLASDGTVVLKPSVNLDDYLYIDFVSTWHLHKDTSLNIYIK